MRLSLLLAASMLAAPAFALAQGNGGGNNGLGGVLIDPSGALTARDDKTLGTKLDKERQAAFAADNLPADLNADSDARKVSLRKLEAALAAAAAAGEEPDEAMRFLAGLTRIDAVLVQPGTAEEPGDVVLVGPAGGFGPDALGRMISTAEGEHGGRPVLHLFDLLAALRGGEASRGGAIGCSIDPVPERQAALARATANLGPVRSVSQAASVYRKLAEILGDQTIRIYGVPAGSHFGVTLAEADYRMKLVSLGLEPSGVRGLPSHLALIGPGANSAQRFFIVADYEPVGVNADRTAFALRGQRLRMLTEDEVIAADGSRRDAGQQGRSNVAWANRFTEQVPDLAAERPIFAQLQNLYDLAVTAELLRAERLTEKAGWTPGLLLDEAALPVPVGPAPKTVPTAFNTKSTGRTVVGLISGGVSIRAADALREAGQAPDASGELERARADAFAAAGERWWWD
ncbi:DUF1598 domain-containing protein [Alienimonas sp. DA493]|uniref:DUF1598 domain-containing protein n=1 Tax=Alienimonas sp. DA493 TaxID=3373605 RepID=UPI00375530C8